MELRAGDVVNLGFGISPLVPYVLIEEGQGEAVTWAIEQGPVGGVPADGFPFGCAYNAQAILSSPQQFTYFQGGGFDTALLSFLEIGCDGSVNVSRLSAKPHVTAGCGGFVDITANARRIAFLGYYRAGGLELEVGDGRLAIRREGRFAKFVPAVEHVTMSGREARRKGQHITYITERCVLELLPEGLTVTEIAPGIDLDRDVLARADVPLRVSERLRPMDAALFTRAAPGLPQDAAPR